MIILDTSIFDCHTLICDGSLKKEKERTSERKSQKDRLRVCDNTTKLESNISCLCIDWLSEYLQMFPMN